MIFDAAAVAKEPLLDLFRSLSGLECKNEDALTKTLSRIAYNRSFGQKWYQSTPLIWPNCRPCLMHSVILSFLICIIATVISCLLLIYVRVDFYMRYANLWGRLLREATGNAARYHHLFDNHTDRVQKIRLKFFLVAYMK